MSWIAVAIGGSALLGVGASIYGADKQASAAGQAASQQLAQYQQTRADLAPWVQQGRVSLQQLGGMIGPGGQLTQQFTPQQYLQSPAYQFNLSRGLDVLNKAANARGNLYAPQTLQDLTKFGTGMAQQDYQQQAQNYADWQRQVYGMLSGQAQAGGQAAMGTGQLGAGAVQSAGQFGTSGAAAQAAGMMGAANAISGGVGDYYNQMLMQQILGSQDPYGGVAGMSGAYGGMNVPPSNQYLQPALAL